MKRKKSDGLLHIYEELKAGGVINKKQISEKLNVSTKTIERYIEDLKAYFLNENMSEHIRYSRKKRGYILETSSENYLTQKDILAISKVLLESRGFSRKELDKLIQKLLMNCVYKDRTYIRDALANEIMNYIEPKHKKNLIDKLWDLDNAIKTQRIIKIFYYKVGKDGKLEDRPTQRILEPRGILFSEYYFYLIAFIHGRKYEYPAIYRVDRIKEYKVLEEGFKIDYQKRFKGGEFRNRIQFMQAGKLQTVKFKFKGESIEAILDRLPTAEVENRDEGEYFITAEIFGRGIKMWLLSQGDAIEVLEPKELREEMKLILKKTLSQYE